MLSDSITVQVAGHKVDVFRVTAQKTKAFI